MIISDDPNLIARLLLKPSRAAPNSDRGDERFGGPSTLRLLHERFLSGSAHFSREVPIAGGLDVLIAARHAPTSQFDELVSLARTRTPDLRGLAPHGLACIAETGDGFHGHRRRTWVAESGNLHLSAIFWLDGVPGEAAPALTALPAVAVVDALDHLLGAPVAGIKWVNDVHLENAKIAGVLSHSGMEGRWLTHVVFGIGLNVESRPRVAPTPFVPRVTTLADHAPEITLEKVLPAVLTAVKDRLHGFVQNGAETILKAYRSRSLVIGRRVAIFPDPFSKDSGSNERADVIEGRVTGLNDQLELELEGHAHAIARGRLVLTV